MAREHQISLLAPPVLPGFFYQPEFVTSLEERQFVAEIERLEFRRIVHFGLTYGYYSRRTKPGDPLPKFLLPLRERAAAWAAIPSRCVRGGARHGVSGG